jgi:hypothetical protein
MRGFLSDLWIFLPRCVCFSITSFLLLKEHPPAFVLNPIMMRRTSPCVVLISSGQRQQFYRTTSNLYPTIPRSATQGAFAQNPLTKKLPISLFPRPHTSGKFSIFLAETSIATSTFFFRQVSSRQAGKMAHALRNPILSKISETVWRLRFLEVDNMIRLTT